MTALFSAYLQAGFFSGVMILAALLVRPFLRKAPRNILCLIWLLVGIRLLIPFQLESSLSLQPSYPLDAQTITQTQPDPTPPPAQPLPTAPSVQEAPPAIQTVIPSVTVPAPEETAPLLPPQPVTADPTPVPPISWERLIPGIWLIGITLMLLYTFVSYGMIRHRVREAVPCSDGTWETHRIGSAFLLGYFRPRIYLPEGIPSPERNFILTHERTHLQRRDNWWKLLGMLCVSIHWYNPLVWLSYILLCRDIEVACDQQVIRSMALEERKAYSFALLSSSQRASRMLLHPVTFGEVNLKQRIRHVLSYRKPKLWITVTGVLLVLMLTVCFMTVPEKSYALDHSESESTQITKPTQPDATQPEETPPPETPATEPSPPVETQPSEPASTQPGETQPLLSESVETTPQKPVESRPEETVPPETQPPSVPEETLPEETKPEDIPNTETPSADETTPPPSDPEQEEEDSLIAPQDTQYWQLTSDGVLTVYSTSALDPSNSWRSYADRITSVVLCDGVTYVPNDMFSGFPRLTQVYFGAAIKKIGSHAFYQCTNLRTVNFAPRCQLETIEMGAFRGTGLLEFITPPNLQKIGWDAFKDCLSLETVVLDGRLWSASSAFGNCPNLKNIVVGITLTTQSLFSGIPSIENARVETKHFFGISNNKNLKTVVLGEKVKRIPSHCFAECTALSQLTLEGPITEVEDYAFYNCTALTSLTLPETVVLMGNRVFAGSGLTQITFLGDVPQLESDTFSQVSATVYYPGDNETWTEAIRQEYGSHLTWIPYS